MSIPENKFPTPEPTGDPKTNNAEQDVVTNTEESNQVVNTDGADGFVANKDGLQETLSDTEPSSATAESGRATEEETSIGDTATDADVAGGNPVIL